MREDESHLPLLQESLLLYSEDVTQTDRRRQSQLNKLLVEVLAVEIPRRTPQKQMKDILFQAGSA